MSEKKTDTQTAKDTLEKTSDLLQALDKAVALKTKLLQEQLDAITEERDKLKKQTIELASVIDNDLRAEKIMNIMAKGDFKRDELEQKTIKELQSIDEILSASKGVAATYKNIRAGASSTTITDSRSTVGNLYGLTRAQILKMGGDF